MPSLIVFIFVGLAAQLVDGSLGMAYGVTSTTLLVATGIAPAMASASVHLAEVGTTLVSGASHWRFGNVDWRTVLLLGVPGAVGAYAGATVLSNLSTQAARPWMSAILLVLGISLLIRFAVRGTRTDRHHLGFKSRFLAPLGLFAGFVDASGGGGWGPIATPTMLVSGRTEPRKVIGSVSASEFLVSVAAGVGFLVNLGSQGIDWPIAGALLVGGAVAAPFAAWLVTKVAPRVLGTVVGSVIVITNSRTLFNQFEIEGSTRTLGYLLIVVGSLVAIVLAVRGVRQEKVASEPVPETL